MDHCSINLKNNATLNEMLGLHQEWRERVLGTTKRMARITLSLLRVIKSKFPCSLTRNMTSHSMENLTFHSLLKCDYTANSRYITHTIAF